MILIPFHRNENIIIPVIFDVLRFDTARLKDEIYPKKTSHSWWDVRSTIPRAKEQSPRWIDTRTTTMPFLNEFTSHDDCSTCSVDLDLSQYSLSRPSTENELGDLWSLWPTLNF